MSMYVYVYESVQKPHTVEKTQDLEPKEFTGVEIRILWKCGPYLLVQSSEHALCGCLWRQEAHSKVLEQAGRPGAKSIPPHVIW